MGIKFKQIDNLQSTFDALSGEFQNQITINTEDISGVYNDSQVLSGWKYFDNNVDISGQQGLLVGADNIYTPNNLIAGGAKIGFPISTPRNSTPAPLGALQVTGGQIYFEDQLNIRNNAGINIENGSITGDRADFDYITGSTLNYITGAFDSSLTISGVSVSTGIQLEADSGVALVNDTLITSGTGNFSTIDFDPIIAPAHQEGRLFYDSDNFTLSLYNDEADISLQVGQEEYLRVRNNTTGTISNGSVVRINGSQGTHPTIDFASADSEQNAQAVGLATHDIEAASFGYVTTYGIVRGLNTIGFTAGDEVYLSETSGALTSGEIIAPNYRITIGHVVRSHINQGTVLVQPGQAKLGGGDIKGLKDPNIGGITFFEQAIDGAGIICSKDDFIFKTGASLQGDSYVGINTSNPLADLHITSYRPTIRLSETGNLVGNFEIRNNFNVAQFLSNKGYSFYSNGVEAISIDNQARVGIGNYAPQSILDVKSTSSAVTLTRLTSTQMNSFNGQGGMIAFNTEAKKFYGKPDVGASWKLLQEPWTPTQLTLNAWYDAADLSTFDLSGNYVSAWRDKSFKGNHVLQSNTGQQPVAYENSHNGLNVLAFSPNDTLISNGSTIEDQDQTWMVVFKPTETDNVNDGFLSYYDNNAANLSGSWQLESADGSAFYGKIRKGPASNVLPTTTFASADQSGNYIMLGWDFDRQNLQHSSWLNGFYNDSGISDTTGIVPNMDIKVMTNRSDNQFPGGEFAEILCFSGILSNEDRQKAEGYLAHKWNLTGSLNSSHPFKFFKP